MGLIAGNTLRPLRALLNGIRCGNVTHGAPALVRAGFHLGWLHAKAWLLRRNNGFHIAYVGSSNLLHAALVDGLEWNVRISAMSTPYLLEKFRATFDSYWVSRDSERYRPAEDGNRLREALETASGFANATRWPSLFPDSNCGPSCSRLRCSNSSTPSAHHSRPAPQPDRRRHRHRQDRHGRPGLPPAGPRRPRPRPHLAVRRAPQRDPGPRAPRRTGGCPAVVVPVRMDVGLLEALNARAEQEQVSRSEATRDAVHPWIDVA